jgi:transcriptional regulator with XRE-family HTH domain
MSSINEKINDIAIKEYKGNNSAFAKVMGTSEANIRNYRKETMPKLDFVVKLHDAFDISFEYLLSEKIEVGKYKIKEEKKSIIESEFYHKIISSENEFLKEKLKFQQEQIEFYKNKIEFLTTQPDIKKALNAQKIDEGLKIIEEIENIALKKSIK